MDVSRITECTLASCADICIPIKESLDKIGRSYKETMDGIKYFESYIKKIIELEVHRQSNDSNMSKFVHAKNLTLPQIWRKVRKCLRIV